MALMFQKLTAALVGMVDYEHDPAMPYAYVSDGDTIAEELQLALDAFEWCRVEFGPQGDRWVIPHHGVVRFRVASDAFAFRMRWC